ncbi:hypothetical protein K445DRAFT_313610 [Daldinia sp. EC12]|nr:hypothetical protein K445DRAFT_313610 [Daldinia sp. EC12]
MQLIIIYLVLLGNISFFFPPSSIPVGDDAIPMGLSRGERVEKRIYGYLLQILLVPNSLLFWLAWESPGEIKVSRPALAPVAEIALPA